MAGKQRTRRARGSRRGHRTPWMSPRSSCIPIGSSSKCTATDRPRDQPSASSTRRCSPTGTAITIRAGRSVLRLDSQGKTSRRRDHDLAAPTDPGRYCMTRNYEGGMAGPPRASAAARLGLRRRLRARGPRRLPGDRLQRLRRSGCRTQTEESTGLQVTESLIELVGGTPLLRLRRVAASVPPQVLSKVEYLNPGGSVKDRIALAMVEDAEARGLIPARRDGRQAHQRQHRRRPGADRQCAWLPVRLRYAGQGERGEDRGAAGVRRGDRRMPCGGAARMSRVSWDFGDGSLISRRR